MRLILLPGLDGTGRLYDAFSAALGSEIQLTPIAYPLDLPLGFDALAERVRPELPVHEARWILAGESFSGPLAIRLAGERPPGLAGLVLVATYARRPLPIAPWLVPTLAFRIRPPRSLLRALMFEAGASDGDVDFFIECLVSVRAEALAARARAALGADACAQAAQIGVPVLYLRAQADRLFPESVHAVVERALPQMHTETIASAPHLLLQRRPEEAARAIERWLRGIRAPSSS